MRRSVVWRATILIFSVVWAGLAPVVAFAVPEPVVGAHELALELDPGPGAADRSWEPGAGRIHDLTAPREPKPQAPAANASRRGRDMRRGAPWRESTRPGVARAYPPRRHLHAAWARSQQDPPS